MKQKMALSTAIKYFPALISLIRSSTRLTYNQKQKLFHHRSADEVSALEIWASWGFAWVRYFQWIRVQIRVF